MQEFLTVVLYPSLFAFLGIAATKFWDWIKPKFQTKIDNADAKSKEIDNDIKSVTFYQNVLDDATKRINSCLELIDQLNNKLIERDKIIESQDLENSKLKKQISQLMDSNETLITEIKKFKQLNGKTE